MGIQFCKNKSQTTMKVLLIVALAVAAVVAEPEAEADAAVLYSGHYGHRMMMTSGTGVHYKSAFDAGGQIMKNEGITSFFKGNGANILRGVAGAGVLSGFDFVKAAYIQKVHGA